MKPLTPAQTCVLTSLPTSQTLTVPIGYGTLEVYNAAADTVFLKWAASVAVPTSTWADGVIAVQPETTQSFGMPPGATSLSYIAQTLGGALVISVGEGF